MGKSNCQTDPRNWKQVKYELMQFRLHQPEQRSNQESNLITNQGHSVLYDNAKILPMYQKLEQWKESAEQEAKRKQTDYQSSAQCIVWQRKNFTNVPKTRAMKGISWTRSKKKANWLPIKRTVYCMTTQKFYQCTKN